MTYHGQCWKNVPWNGGKRPAGTSGIRVRLGHMHTGIRFALRKTTIALGSITGTITEQAGGHPLRNAFVTVFTSRGAYTNSGTTNRYGKYTVRYMPASSAGYLVCVDARYAHASIPTPTTGWAPRCYKDAAWNGVARPPSAATHVPLTAGQHKTGVDIRLRPGGAVSGTVHAVNGPPLADVWVEVFTPSGVGVAQTQSGSTGTYTIPSLSPATYVVCFDGRFLDGAAYRPQCYDNVPWSGSG